MVINKRCHCSQCKVIRELVEFDYEFRKLDGTNNNNNGGSVNKQLIRLTTPAYGDGLNTPSGQTRGNPREISNKIFNQPCPIPNPECVTNMFWLWGQFIDHDLTLVNHSITECFDINVPKGDKFFDPECTGTKIIPFKRSLFDPTTGKTNPRQQLNSITSFIDGSAIYGTTTDRNDFLRTFKCGKLKQSAGYLLPINDSTIDNATGNNCTSYFVAGDIRSNEHIGLTSMHTLWVREHNYWADRISECYNTLCDEEIYQRAKIIVEAELQAITFNDFLPILLGYCSVSKYDGFKVNVNPQISNEFATAAYRFGHTLISSDLYNDLDKTLKDTFFSANIISNDCGIEPILKALTKKLAQELDAKVIHDLRNFLFGEPGQGGLDLVSLNIQRGRDHGLPDYNTIRHELGLEKITTFSDLTDDPIIQDCLKQLYGNVDNIDVWVGGLIETHKYDSMLGELFHKIIKEQFERIRDGDRFWYECRLTKNIINYVNCTTLSDVIKRNTYISSIKDNVFLKKVYCHCGFNHNGSCNIIPLHSQCTHTHTHIHSTCHCNKSKKNCNCKH